MAEQDENENKEEKEEKNEEQKGDVGFEDEPSDDAPDSDEEGIGRDETEAPDSGEEEEEEYTDQPFETEVNQSKKKYGYIWGTGRRKTSVTRVRMKEGDGKIVVNGKDYKEYFNNLKDQVSVEQPLRDTDQLGELDIYINAQGGGKAGQAEAALLGIARALVKANPDLESRLRDEGHLTRDPRMKERRKYGQHGARRGKQYSKR